MTPLHNPWVETDAMKHAAHPQRYAISNGEMKMSANGFVLPSLVFLSVIFALCNLTLADDAALRRLSVIRVRVNVPDDSGPLSFQLRNTLELNLRKAGLKLNSEAAAELRLNVVWMDIDPGQKQIIGKYGSIQLSLHEPAILVREQGVTTWACTWEGMIAFLHGPPDTFADRTRQWAADLTDDFLNRWMKVNTTMKKQRD